MKKMLPIVLVLLMLAPILANAENTLTTEVGTYPIVNEPYELTIWCVQPSDIEDYATNGQTVWYESYSGIHVKWVTVPSQGRYQALQLSVMSGELPDIYLILLDNSDLDPMIEFGAIICLEDLIQSETVYMKAALEADPSLHGKAEFIDGKIYAAWQDTLNTMSTYDRLYVYKPWLDSYTEATGFGMPQTTEEYRQMLAYFRDNDMNGNGDAADEIPMLGTSGMEGFFFLMGSFEPTPWRDTTAAIAVNDDGTVKFTANTDAFREGIRYVRSLYEENLLTEESFVIDWTMRNSIVSVPRSDVRVGVIVADCIDNAVVLGADDSYVNYDDYIVIPPLEGPEGVRAATFNEDHTVTYRGVITSACEHPEIAIRWLDYWYSDEGRQWIIRGGQEGVQWWWDEGTTINGEGKVVRQSDDYQVMHNAAWSNSVVPVIIKEEDYDTMDASQLATNAFLRNELDRRIYQKYAFYHNWPSVYTNDKEIGMETGELGSNIRSVIVQAYTAFILGRADINNDADWNTYISNLNAAGLPRLLELTNQIAKGFVK